MRAKIGNIEGYIPVLILIILKASLDKTYEYSKECLLEMEF